ncbi:MAG: PqqD family peptide modification chaperone [Suilimivivens sp.]
MKKRQLKSENFLERVPVRVDAIHWYYEENQKVTLEVENRGLFNRIAQKTLKRPRISYIHLDEMGSFIWPLLDGRNSIAAISKMVEEKFEEKAYPLYERLLKFLLILDGYGFIEWKISGKRSLP